MWWALPPQVTKGWFVFAVFGAHGALVMLLIRLWHGSAEVRMVASASVDRYSGWRPSERPCTRFHAFAGWSLMLLPQLQGCMQRSEHSGCGPGLNLAALLCAGRRLGEADDGEVAAVGPRMVQRTGSHQNLPATGVTAASRALAAIGHNRARTATRAVSAARACACVPVFSAA
jgi:hypothetical protein